MPEDDELNGRKHLDYYRAFSPPLWPRRKENNKTWMSSLEGLGKKKIHCLRIQLGA